MAPSNHHHHHHHQQQHITVGSAFALGCTVARLPDPVAFAAARQGRVAPTRERRRLRQRSWSRKEEKRATASRCSTRPTTTTAAAAAAAAAAVAGGKACSIGAWPVFEAEFDSSLYGVGGGDDGGPTPHKSLPLMPRAFSMQFGRSESRKWPPAATGELQIAAAARKGKSPS
ncbi:hypothetical protein VTK26DRAFT_9067 [Humicola hyalothermophila]